MSVNFKVLKAFSVPSSNGNTVIGKVHWTVAIEDDGVVSMGGGDTILGAPSEDGFIAFENLTEQQLIDWVVAKEGGQGFVDMLSSLHQPNIARLKLERGMQEVVLPFALPAAPVTPAVAEIYQGPKAVAGVIPTVIF